MTRQISDIHKVSSGMDPEGYRDGIATRREAVSGSGELPGHLDFGIWDLEASLPATPPCLKAELYLPASLVCSKRWKRVADESR